MLLCTDFNVASKTIAGMTDTVEKCLKVSREIFKELKDTPNMPAETRERCVQYIFSGLNKANQVANTPKSSTGYDLWALDEAWDNGAGSSNAEMHFELSKISGVDLAPYEKSLSRNEEHTPAPLKRESSGRYLAPAETYPEDKYGIHL